MIKKITMKGEGVPNEEGDDQRTMARENWVTVTARKMRRMMMTRTDPTLRETV